MRLQHHDGVSICSKSRIMSSFWLKIPDKHRAMAGTGQFPKVTQFVSKLSQTPVWLDGASAWIFKSAPFWDCFW
jgi:hypothetical protein